jgi:hypothetical protein
MKKFIFLLTLVAITNCKPKESEIKQIKKQFYSTIQIPIDQNFNPDLSRIQHFDSDSGEYLAIQNKTNFELGIFSLDSLKIHQTIPLRKEGPNGIGLMNGFTIKSKDTILIASIPPRIHLINFHGEKYSTIKIDDPERKANYLSSNNETPLILEGKKLFGIQPYFQDLYNISFRDVENTRPIFKLTILPKGKSELEWLNINRPKDEWDNGKKSLDVSWADNGDSILIAPQLDHRIWIISKKEERLLGLKEIKSSQINGFRIIKDSPVGDVEIIKDLENGRYELFLYDQYRKIYYRFFYPSIKIESYDLTPRKMMQNHPKLGVMVLDKNLNILGQHLFETNYAQAWNYFVGKKGLYVSTNNPNRDDFDENFLRYDIIRFEGLNYED